MRALDKHTWSNTNKILIGWIQIEVSFGNIYINPIRENINKNLIYFRSPIGKALIGKKKNDLITVVTPSGEKNFEITEVKYI